MFICQSDCEAYQREKWENGKLPTLHFTGISMNTETLLKETTSFRDDLLQDLADMEFAMYYLEAALSDYKEDGNTEALWTALYDVVAAQGGMGKSASGE